MGGMLHLVQRGGDWAEPPRPLLTVANVTAHPSAASVPTLYYSMWHYNWIWSLKGWMDEWVESVADVCFCYEITLWSRQEDLNRYGPVMTAHVEACRYDYCNTVPYYVWHATSTADDTRRLKSPFRVKARTWHRFSSVCRYLGDITGDGKHYRATLWALVLPTHYNLAPMPFCSSVYLFVRLSVAWNAFRAMISIDDK